jgi:hypothetical protein
MLFCRGGLQTRWLSKKVVEKVAVEEEVVRYGYGYGLG